MSSATMRLLLRHGLQVLLTGVALFAAAVWYVGSPSALLAFVQGHEIAVEKLVKKGEGQWSVVVRNLTSREFSLVGAQLPCACMEIKPLPSPIPPNALLSLQLQLKPNAEDRRYVVQFFTDSSVDPILFISVTHSR